MTANQAEPEGQSFLPVAIEAVPVPDECPSSDGPRHCTGHKTNGEPCPNFAMRDSRTQKCHAHGGMNPGGPVTNALRTRNIPERLRERYEELTNAPDYVSLRKQIGTIELRIEELWRRMSEHDSSKRRVEILDEMDSLVKLVNSKLTVLDTLTDIEDFDPDDDDKRADVIQAVRSVTSAAAAIRQSVARIQASAHDDRREDEVWDDMDRFSESLRKLKETEVKRMVAANQVLTVTESYNLIQRLVTFVEGNMSDDVVCTPQLRARAIRELYSLLDRKGSKQS